MSSCQLFDRAVRVPARLRGAAVRERERVQDRHRLRLDAAALLQRQLRAVHDRERLHRTGTDQQCVDGACTSGCKHNEQCPLFNECQSGECVEVGCKSARECYFATKNPLSECRD